MKEFVLSCEGNYTKQVLDVARSIAGDSSVKFVMLCGPSCSGKTTTASILFSELAQHGKQAEVISIDDFIATESNMNPNLILKLRQQSTLNISENV